MQCGCSNRSSAPHRPVIAIIAPKPKTRIRKWPRAEGIKWGNEYSDYLAVTFAYKRDCHEWHQYFLLYVERKMDNDQLHSPFCAWLYLWLAEPPLSYGSGAMHE